jgi:hypothetical protein
MLAQNPIPYVRTTGKMKFFSKPYKRYQAWGEFIRKEFCERNGIPYWPKEKPIKGVPKFHIELELGFKGRAHGDPDNILKGVLDALFDNDKDCLFGTFKVVSDTEPIPFITIVIKILKEDDDGKGNKHKDKAAKSTRKNPGSGTRKKRGVRRK